MRKERPLLLHLVGYSAGYARGGWVVDSLSLDLAPGECVGLTGESGSGKSTLLKALAGLLPATAVTNGTCDINGRIGYIPQDLLASLSPYLTVWEQVPEEATRWLTAVGLIDARRQQSYPHQLSGGERQRVLIAQALAAKPDLILADEPTANLDPETERMVLDLLSTHVRETGAGLLIVSHRDRVFRKLGCRVVRMTDSGLPPPIEPAVGVSTTILLAVHRLHKTYFRRDWLLRERPSRNALRDVSLTIREAETVALTGPSGSGKTTLARCIARREAWDSGTIETGAVQLVSQEPSESLNPRLSIRECLREANGNATAEQLERLRLPCSWLDRKTTELSEGQRARLAIARSIAAVKNGLLILDESLTGLDSVTRAHILAYIREMQSQFRFACLLITHDDEVAASAASRILHMQKGRLSA